MNKFTWRVSAESPVDHLITGYFFQDSSHFDHLVNGPLAFSYQIIGYFNVVIPHKTIAEEQTAGQERGLMAPSITFRFFPSKATSGRSGAAYVSVGVVSAD